MSQFKAITLIALFCMLLPAAAAKEQATDTALSLDSIFKSLGDTANGLGSALDETVNGLGNALDGTVNALGSAIDDTANGLGNAIDDTVNGLGQALDGVACGLGEIFEGTGDVLEDVAEVAAVAGLLYLFVIADGHFYYNHHH